MLSEHIMKMYAARGEESTPLSGTPQFVLFSVDRQKRLHLAGKRGFFSGAAAAARSRRGDGPDSRGSASEVPGLRASDGFPAVILGSGARAENVLSVAARLLWRRVECCHVVRACRRVENQKRVWKKHVT